MVSFAVYRFVQEGEVPSGREIGVGFEIAGLRREEEGSGGSDDLTEPEIRIKELATCQVAAIISGVRRSEVGSGKTGSEAGSSKGKRGSGK
jgi:hypothetical protein